MDVIDHLQKNWLTLLQSWAVDPADAHICFLDLVQKYTTPNRHYHNLAHIAAVLQFIQELPPLAQDAAALQIAAWFHDAVYEPGAGDNEEQSAVLAQQALTTLGLPPATIETVIQLILATKSHHPTPNPDSQILLDADLAILAAEPAAYDGYVQAIRQEYSYLPDDAFQNGRRQFLRGFLGRPHFFYTSPHLEPLARANLQREMEALSSSPLSL